jgi:hypothetical protein
MYCILNENVHIPDCIESDGRITNKRRIGSDVQGSGRGLVQVLSAIRLKRLTKETTIGVKIIGFLVS